MADFFKGLQGGFQTGLQLGQAIRQRRQEEDLAKAYGLTPEEQQAALATPEQLAGARAETQALQQQDIADFGLTPEEAQRYAPTMPQEGQRVGLSTYNLGGQTFQQAPTQAQIDSARMRAAADVYGRYGDAAKREELMRGLRAEERATAAETRAQTGFETQQEESRLRIRAAQAQATERDNTEQARKELSARKAANKGTLTLQDFNEISGKYNLDPTKFVQADEVLESKQIKDTKRALSTAALKGEAGVNEFLASRFDPDKTDNITPKLGRDKAGNLVVMYGDQVLSEYGAHKNVMSLVGGVINVIDEKPFETLKTLSDLEYKAAATKEALAKADRYRELGADDRKRMTPEQVKRLNELSIQISEAEDAGKGKDAAKLRSQWEREYITAAGGMGKVVQPKAAGLVREMSDLDKENLKAYREWEKDSRNARLPQGEKDRKAAELGVTQFLNRGAGGPTTGLGANPYAASAATPTTATETPAPAAGLTFTDEERPLFQTYTPRRGYGVPDGRSLLVTPSYEAGMTPFRPRD